MNVLILIPVDSDNGGDAKITTLMDVKKWALVEFAGGTAKSTQFFDDRTQTGADWIDFIVLDNKFENYMDFMNDGMMCLVKRDEETLDDVVSAFAFKELDEIGL